MKTMKIFVLHLICISLSQVFCTDSTMDQSTNPNTNGIPDYDIVLSVQTLSNIVSYKRALSRNSVTPGFYLMQSLKTYPGYEEIRQLGKMPNEQFIEVLLSTKKPLIFAEISVKSNGEDWNDTELQLLGDLNIAMKVKIYDNGVWIPSTSKFCRHNPPIDGTLLFMPGPLLDRGMMTQMAPDLKEIISGDKISQANYNQLIERRLAPLLYYANEDAKKNHWSALITIPGVGCGSFSGTFAGTMGEHLNRALKYILAKHAMYFTHIAYVHYDPHTECSNEEHDFRNVKYRVRPSHMPQLSKPTSFEEGRDNFSHCALYKVVAWDHVSYPGNDFFMGNRHTDDGVSAAATNSMKVITGVEGTYNGEVYKPPAGSQTWKNVVEQRAIKLRAKDNVKVLMEGLLLDVKDSEITGLFCPVRNFEL